MMSVWLAVFKQDGDAKLDTLTAALAVLSHQPGRLVVRPLEAEWHGLVAHTSVGLCHCVTSAGQQGAFPGHNFTMSC